MELRAFRTALYSAVAASLFTIAAVSEPAIAQAPRSDAAGDRTCNLDDNKAFEREDQELTEMSREAAKKILETVIRHGAEQNEVLLEVQHMCSTDEFALYKRMIGRSMGAMLLDVMNPIIEMYPDLKPAGLE
jgi:hypothetical protein